MSERGRPARIPENPHAEPQRDRAAEAWREKLTRRCGGAERVGGASWGDPSKRLAGDGSPHQGPACRSVGAVPVGRVRRTRRAKGHVRGIVHGSKHRQPGAFGERALPPPDRGHWKAGGRRGRRWRGAAEGLELPGGKDAADHASCSHRGRDGARPSRSGNLPGKCAWWTAWGAPHSVAAVRMKSPQRDAEYRALP